MSQPANFDDEVRITLRAGVIHRHRLPNYVVLNHEYGEKPRFKWIKPLSASERVQDALHYHVAFKAIAKAAKLSERQCRATLLSLQSRGLVRPTRNDCWTTR